MYISNVVTKTLLLLAMYCPISIWAFDFDAVKSRFEYLVDRTIDWRARTIEFNMSLNDPKRPFTSREITIIHEQISNEYQFIRNEYLEIINVVKPIAEYDASQIYYNREGINGDYVFPVDWYTSLLKETLLYDYFLKDRKVYAIDVSTDTGLQAIRNMKMGLAAAVILYDNYALVINQLQQSVKVRRLVNYDNLKHSKLIEEMNSSFNRKTYYSLLRSYNIYLQHKEQEKNSKSIVTDFSQYCDAIIEKSYLYSMRDKLQLANVRKISWNLFFQRFEDKLDLKRDNIIGSASKFFGNSVGLVATRKGKMLAGSEREFAKRLEKLTSILKPFDLLLEKTPFRLTDKFIPGFWGHLGIWLGTEQQLRSSGIWDKVSKELKAKIQSGNYILEALRPGVQVNSLKSFLNIDDLAIIRPNFINNKLDLEHYMLRAEKQIGKEYDFNFDVETDSRIVCSELAYVVYDDPEMDWVLKNSVGRYTISPDHVALKATSAAIKKSNYSFTPISIYRGGIEVPMNSNFMFEFEKLLTTY